MSVPSTGPARSAFWTWIFRIGAVAGALPLFFARHLPFADLPEHLATIATLRHYFSPEWKSQEYFVVESALRSQYLFYDLLAAGLAFPLGTAERANLLLLVLTALAFPYSLRELLRAFGRDERLALFAVPLFWNRALGEGLIPFIASIPVVLFALALVARQIGEPTRRRAIALAGLAITVFYLHLSSFVMLAGGALLMAALMPGRERLPRRLFWLAPCAIPAALFLMRSTVANPQASEGLHATVVRSNSWRMLLLSLPGWMHDSWRSAGDDWAAGVAWIGLTIAVVAGFRARRALPPSIGPRARGGIALIACALALYFALPTQVGFAFLLDLRMAPFVGLFAVLLALPSVGRPSHAAAMLVTGAAIFTGLHGAREMALYEQDEARHIDHVLRNMPQGKRLLTLAFDPGSRYTTIAPFLHVGGYYRARYGGIASFSFAELPHWPVRYRPEVAPPQKPIVFWDFAPCQYRNTVDGPYFDYVLVRGEEHPFAKGLAGPKFRLIGGAKDFRLYQRRTDVPWTPGDDVTGPCTASEPVAAR